MHIVSGGKHNGRNLGFELPSGWPQTTLKYHDSVENFDRFKDNDVMTIYEPARRKSRHERGNFPPTIRPDDGDKESNETAWPTGAAWLMVRSNLIHSIFLSPALT